VNEVDPRAEAEAQIARALQIVVDATDEETGPFRDYTPDELETLFFALGTAMISLAKIPGGKDARERYYANCVDQLIKRGRQDMLDSLEVEKERRAEAKRLVKKAFGDHVDFSPGTSGAAMAKVFELELGNQDELRKKLEAVAATLL
jgi:hypothetical protein